jgi:hypothetical protein
MLFGEKKMVPNSVSGPTNKNNMISVTEGAPVQQQVSADPPSVEAKCFQFLLQDFMNMYREGTGQTLFKPPNNKQHVDPHYIGSSVNMPSTKFNAGKKVILWCEDCYLKQIETPLVVCKFIYDDQLAPSPPQEGPSIMDDRQESSSSPPPCKRQKTGAAKKAPPPSCNQLAQPIPQHLAGKSKTSCHS